MTVKLEDLKINAKNSVDDKALLDNIQYNLRVIPRWLSPSTVHDGKALIVSAGRSLKGHVAEIKRKQEEEGYSVFCIKHALDELVKGGVAPDGVFVLDPRTNKGYSTHGTIREDLYKNVPEKTIVFVASMTSKDVTDSLLASGVNVVGWHAAVSGLHEYLNSKNIVTMIINQGTSSATRAIGVVRMLGFKHIELVAYDSDVEEPTDAEKRERNVEGPPKYQSILARGKLFWSTGELLAQVQDIKGLVHFYSPQLKHFSMWPGGLGYETFITEVERREELDSNKNLPGLVSVPFADQMESFRKRKTYKMTISSSDSPDKDMLIEDQVEIIKFLQNIGKSDF